MSLHLPGYRYCGPGTDIEQADKDGGPINELDRACREHDLDLADTSELTQDEADEKFIASATKQGWLGNALGEVIYIKSTLQKLHPGLSPYIPGQKSKKRKLETATPTPVRKEVKKKLGVPTHKKPEFASDSRVQHPSKPIRPTNTIPYPYAVGSRVPAFPRTNDRSSSGVHTNPARNIRPTNHIPQKPVNKRIQEIKKQHKGEKSQKRTGEPSAKRLRTDEENVHPDQSGNTSIDSGIDSQHPSIQHENTQQEDEVDMSAENTNMDHSHSGNIGGTPSTSTANQDATKAMRVKFTRTIRHYITLPSDLDNKFKQGWSDIPYQHICASLKVSDWQALNTFARRWTPIRCGFVMHNIIPIENTLTSTGGAVTPKVVYQTQPYLETFTDTDNILPIQKMYTETNLPNNNLSLNSTVPSKSTLTHVEWERNKFQPDIKVPGYKAFVKQGHNNFDLMNSWNWNTITPEENHGHNWISTEVKWRHAMTPPTGSNLSTPASYMGRWDGGERLSAHKANYNYTSQQLDNYNTPAPSCLIRPMQLYGNNDVLNNISFMVLITYQSEIYMDLNDTRYFPFYNAVPKDEDDQVMDLYKSQHPTLTNLHKQFSGTNCHNFVTGPADEGCII